MSSASLHFGPFRLDPPNRRLWRGDAAVELNARYLDVLILLVEAQGDLVTKDRFMDEVWRGIPVTDEALTQAIRSLRRALGDDAARPVYIETVPKYGYRFAASLDGEVQDDALPAPSVPLARRGFIRTVLAGTAGAGLAGVGIGLVYGFLGAAGQPSAGGGGALSLLLVLMLVTVFAAAVAGLGIAAGIAAARLIRPQAWYWSLAGGALGGLLLGGFGHVIGADAFRLLVGGDLDHFAGAGEGVVIGAATGLAAARAARGFAPLALGAWLGLIGGVAVSLADGRMMAGSFQALGAAFPASSIGGVFGESGLGPAGLAVTGGIEGAAFVAAMVWGLRRFDRSD
ncbi:MAG: transcriptional regulator [Erythrobacter sp.]|jgi:DNA-binding winged helix-turn-helix (wHTH) protein|uniref:winged helix-turn-helix domain-containing protein n=1 Tax=Erythrobacter sp. TaxID=1042 RepID=UPI002B4793C3|nr:transcriptional regulator [Erythrobacter sp.]WRH70872.1 MAG: transcriptional regulator [Erythrobacter sp.]